MGCEIVVQAIAATQSPYVEKEDLNPIAKKLVKRLQNEMDRYSNEPDDGECLAMLVYPVMAFSGLKLLKNMGHTTLVNRAKDIFVATIEIEHTRSVAGAESGLGENTIVDATTSLPCF